MNAVLKEKCLIDIRATIANPRSSQTDNILSISYVKDGEPKFLTLKRTESYPLLVETGVISYYTSNGTMYTKKMITREGRNGAPLQTEAPIVLRWEDLELTKRDLLKVISLYELNQTFDKNIKIAI